MTEYGTVWIVEFLTEEQPGEWFVHGLALHTPEKDGMVKRLMEDDSVIGIFVK